MDLMHLPLVAALPLLLIASGICSSAETALFSITHSELMRLRRVHASSGRAVAALRRDPRALLVTILLLNMLTNVSYFVISSVLARNADSPMMALVISLASLLAIILFGEVLAKLIARAHRVSYCALLGPSLLFVFRAISPVRKLIEQIVIRPLSRVIRPADHPPVPPSVEELGDLLNRAAHAGFLHADEQQLLADVVALGTLRVRDVMVPRVDVPHLDEHDSADAVMEVVRATGHAKLPIFAGDHPEELVGVLRARPYLAAKAREGSRAVRMSSFFEEPTYVPELSRLDDLLMRFRELGGHVGVVVDELGSIVGLVEIEHVVEQLGLVSDESADTSDPDVVERGPGKWSISARLPARELADLLAYELRSSGGKISERVNTVGGLVMVALGRVPRAGDSVRLGGVRLRVESMRGRIIQRVEVTLGSGGENPVDAAREGVGS